MGDFSSLGQQSQNFSQSTAFAAALQRAKQVGGFDCILFFPFFFLHMSKPLCIVSRMHLKRIQMMFVFDACTFASYFKIAAKIHPGPGNGGGGCGGGGGMGGGGMGGGGMGGGGMGGGGMGAGNMGGGMGSGSSVGSKRSIDSDGSGKIG